MGGLISVILFLTGQIDSKVLLKNILLIFDRYWFVEVYLVLMLASVVINGFINNVSNKQLNRVVAVGFVIFSLYGFVHECTRIGVSRGYSIVWGVYLYLVGAWIRKFPDVKRKTSILIYSISTGLYLMTSIGLIAFEKTSLYWKYGIAYNNPLVLVSSVSFFYFLKSLNIGRSERCNKIIRFFSTTTIGVYLIHAAPGLNLFQRINLSLDTMGNCILFTIIALLGSGLVYIVCSFLDNIRQKTIAVPINKGVDKIILYFAESKK